MKNHLKKMLMALISARENEQLYRGRGVSGAPSGVRNGVTLAVCSAIAAFLFMFMISLSLRNNTVENYLSSRQNIKLIDNSAVNMFFTVPEPLACASPEICFEALAAKPLFTHTASDLALPLSADYSPMVIEEKRKMLLVMSVPVDLTVIDPEINDLMIRLPRVFYERAELFLGGTRVASALNRDSLVLPFSRDFLKDGRLEAHLVLDVTMGQDARLINWREDSFVASHYEFKKFAEFLSVRRLNSTSQVGTVARVVLAVFVLLLFIIVESSPEALGLALFMGFEACAMTTGFMDLKRFWITSDINLNFFVHYCNAMGDVFRLYFFVQLCRIAKPSPGKWLAWASVYGVIYGLLRHYNVDIGIPNWSRYHIAQRDLLVSTIGMILCINTIRHLRKRKLPWRIWALSLAGLAATAQWLGAAPTYLTFLRDIGDSIGGYSSLINAINANSAYLFALSTFINISTLENRVKVLSGEKARAEAMEKELELGRSVQTLFQKVPEMPSDMKVSIHYEAAAYVSGDSYFVHWNEHAEILTFLLNDVTGHGIQAALKAFACNIVARSVWSRPIIKNDRRLDDTMLRKYDQAVTELIHADGDVPDFNAMVGVEFHRERQVLKVYRVNYSFPLIIAPKFDLNATGVDAGRGWSAREMSVGNQVVTEVPIPPGSFIILVSDGFAENVRQRKSLIDAFKSSLAGADSSLDDRALLETALAWEGKKSRKSQDDKTILVFQWNPSAVRLGKVG